MSVASNEPIDLPFLDRLLDSPELWSDRDEEAVLVSEHLLATASPIVALYGPRRSGKTELLRRRVAPILSQSRRVHFWSGTDTPDPSAFESADALVFWDNFETALADEAGRADTLRQVTFATGRGHGCRLVLVIAEDALNLLFQVCSTVPQIIEDVFEIPRIKVRPLFARLTQTAVRHGVVVDETFLAALSRDLAEAEGAPGSELAALLVFEVCRVRPPNDQATEAYYDARGRLAGMLEAHLLWLLERLPEPLDPDLGWAILEEAARGRLGADPDTLPDIADRFDSSVERAAQTLGWLEQSRRIVRPCTAGEYGLVPPQLALAISTRRQRETVADEYQRWLLRVAVRNFAESEALPNEQTFRRIDAQRTKLTLAPEEAALLLRCALAYEDRPGDGGVRYWLRRVRDADARVDILLEALFDSRTDVRRRAAIHLRAFPRDDVRHQLHLIALRDPADMVRTEAIASLDRMKDANLLASLIHELHVPSSPYRTQAIAALAIFTDPAACEALVRVIHANAPGEDAAARRKAIDVLGRQQTPEAVDALLATALDDADADDRERAAHALGAMTSDERLRQALDLLDRRRRAARRWRISLGWRDATRWLAFAVLAALAVFANLFVHGVVLLTMRRWRVGLAFVGVEALAVYLAAALASVELGMTMWLGTFGFGLLVPLSILLVERQSGTRGGWYRRCLGAVLFACWLPGFVAFSGLPSALMRRFGRAVVLTAFEAIGIALVLGTRATESDLAAELAAYIELSGVLSGIWSSFEVIGWAILVATFVVGFGPIWLDAFMLPGRRESLARIHRAEAALASNPLMGGLLLAASGHRAGQSRRMIRTFGRELHEGLRDQWERADAAMRRTIFSAMVRRHDEQSVDFLQTAARTLDWRASVRCLWAGVAFRLAVWPKAVLIAASILVYVEVGGFAVLAHAWLNQPARLETAASASGRGDDERRTAIEGLRQLAEQERSTDVKSAAITSLAAVVARPEFVEDNADLQTAAFDAVVRVAQTAPNQQPLVDAVARALGVPRLQERAIASLRDIGTPAAAMALRAFIEQPVLEQRRETDIAVRQQAIAALAAFSAIDTSGDLLELARSDTLEEALKRTADETLKSDTLVVAEAELRSGNYDEAIRQARAVLKDPSPERVLRAKQVLSRALTLRASMAYNEDKLDEAKDALIEALDRNVSLGVTSDQTALGLNLSFRYHEERALADPRAYYDAYQILAMLVGHDTVDPTLATTVRANLAEVSLTNGRFDEAAARARDRLRRADLDPSTALNLRFIVYAALALNNRDAEAAEARQALLKYHEGLQADFLNEWAYTGTRRYIERLQVPAERKAAVLSVLNQIERPRK